MCFVVSRWSPRRLVNLFLYDLGSLLHKCKEVWGRRLTAWAMTVFVHSVEPYRVPLLSFLSTRQLSRKVPADAGLLCNTVSVLGDTINETFCVLCVRIGRTAWWCLWLTSLSHCHWVSPVHSSVRLSGSVNKPHVSRGVEFAARILVTVLRHSWREEESGRQTEWNVKRRKRRMNKWK
jgi:hypothetical protein